MSWAGLGSLLLMTRGLVPYRGMFTFIYSIYLHYIISTNRAPQANNQRMVTSTFLSQPIFSPLTSCLRKPLPFLLPRLQIVSFLRLFTSLSSLSRNLSSPFRARSSHSFLPFPSTISSTLLYFPSLSLPLSQPLRCRPPPRLPPPKFLPFLSLALLQPHPLLS